MSNHMQSATCKLTKPNFSLSPWSLNVNNERSCTEVKWYQIYLRLQWNHDGENEWRDEKGRLQRPWRRFIQENVRKDKCQREKGEEFPPDQGEFWSVCVYNVVVLHLFFVLFCFSVPLVVLFFFWLASWHAHSICL